MGRRKKHVTFTYEVAIKGLADLQAQGYDEEELMGFVYDLFCEDSIDFETLSELVEFLGYELTDEFKAMSVEEQKQKGHEPFEEQNPSKLEEVDIELLDVCIRRLKYKDDLRIEDARPDWFLDIADLGYYPEINDNEYVSIINNLKETLKPIEEYTFKEVRYMINYIFTHERFDEELVFSVIEDGHMLKLLERLKELVSE